MTDLNTTQRTINLLLSAKAPTAKDLARIKSAVQAAPLRLAVAASGTGCGKGTARQARWLIGLLGVDVEVDTLVMLWSVAYEGVDRDGHWTDPTELSRTAAATAGSEDFEEWRRSMCDAYDAVRRPGLSMDDSARAWSFLSRRVAALHLLGVKVSEVTDLQAVVRQWLPPEYRAECVAA